jgi:predicted dehydrogenase
MFDLLKTDWTKLVHYEKLQIDDKEPLRLEQESFLKAVADKGSKPEVSAEEGLAALACAEMILDSVKKHKWD